MSISLICACKNRYEALRVSLSSWLNFKEISEIIIVDWSSDDPINHITKLDSRIKVVRVSDKKYFNQPQPLNLAASIASGDYILKVDTDYVMNPYYSFIDGYFPSEDSFTSGVHNMKSPEYYDENHQLYMIDRNSMNDDELKEYFDSYSPYFKYLTGLLFISKENFNKVGGYNENLGNCYAFEDDEIFQRLRLLGLKETKLNVDYTLLHLPHPDKKRTENFKGMGIEEEEINKIRKNLGQYYSGDELEWQVEYALSQKHIEFNRTLIGKITDYYVKPQTNWKIIQVGGQNYYAEEDLDQMQTGKLQQFPTVYYVSLEECQDRRDELEKQFKKYNITPKAIISKRFAESDDTITGKYVYQLNDGTKGCCVSHLKAIKEWYETSDDDYAFFCEDDLSLETVEYWNFTWEEFIEKIPDDAECVQLLTIRNEFDTYELRERYWVDWAATAYIITRDYARKLIDTYIQDGTFHLEIPNQDIMPLIENILFASVGKSYTCPLFVEGIKFQSTFVGKDDDVDDGQKTNHKNARELVLNYWKNKNMSTIAIKEEKTELEDLLTQYSLDTENPEKNFNLGIWYEKEGHTAPALSYYLRSAERAYESDKDLAYEALIRGSYCYDKQGTRDGSSRSLLFQAQAFRPDRPEAYFLLSRFAERKEWWQDCYINADLALRYCNFDCPPLKTDVDYPGKYGLLFEKAVSGWWWGKSEQSRSLLREILENYNLNESEYAIIVNNLEKMGGKTPKVESITKFSYDNGFNWSDLTYEDIITIEREIVHEEVYRFWEDVKENDVVLDIGASVGAYTISILDQKPKKVYCVEPSKKLLKTLINNCSEKILNFDENPLVFINNAIISNEDDKINIFGGEEEFSGITFKRMIQKYSIDYIDYMKVDCEGGEYSIFKEENIEFLLNSVGFIAMEVHLNYEGCREKFKNFRDNYLVKFKDYKVMSCTRQNISWGTSIDIKDRIFDNEFIDNYTCEFMIYIRNK